MPDALGALAAAIIQDTGFKERSVAMNSQTGTIQRFPPLVGAVAGILLSFGLLALLPVGSWIERVGTAAGTASGAVNARDVREPPQVAAPAAAAAVRTRAKCEGCGVVESVREIVSDGQSPAVFELTVRLRDGSTRVTSVSNPAQWRPGERTILID